MGRILIVDDERRILQLLGDCFKHDYTVETAMNGATGVERVRSVSSWAAMSGVSAIVLK